MSVIYNALKKTQDHRSLPSESKRPHITLPKVVVTNRLRRAFLLSAFVGVLAIVLLSIVFLQRHWSPKPMPVVATVHPQIITPKLVVNGVFISQHKKMVMINNHLFILGDSIYGKKIIHISANRIELKDKNSTEIVQVTA